MSSRPDSADAAPRNTAPVGAAPRDKGPVDAALMTALTVFAAHDRVLIALDFDGTLAAEVDEPGAARALPDAHAAVLRLAALPGTTVALISGRSLASLREVGRMPDDVPLVGSHGLELHFGPGDDRPTVNDDDRARVVALRSRLSPLVDATEEAWIEDKPAGFAVHTRRVDASAASDLNDAVRATALNADPALTDPALNDESLTDQAITHPAITVREGKNVVEFAVRDATKGDGIRALRERFTPDAVLFAGDDVTDEDALAALRSGDVGIKVGSATTIADHRLADPRAVASMLATLVELRAP